MFQIYYNSLNNKRSMTDYNLNLYVLQRFSVGSMWVLDEGVRGSITGRINLLNVLTL